MWTETAAVVYVLSAAQHVVKIIDFSKDIQFYSRS